MIRRARWAAYGVVLLAAIGPSAADVVPESWEIEIYAGTSDPGIEFLDDDVVMGLRLGYNVTDYFNLTTSVGYYSTDEEVSALGFTGDVEFSDTTIDLSAMLHLIPDKAFNPQLFAGLGWSFVSLDGDITGPGGIAPSSIEGEDDSFTAHGGAGLRIDLGSRVYLNGQIRLRWYEARDEDETVTEYTLGVGFKL
jgi:hypothetical protein